MLGCVFSDFLSFSHNILHFDWKLIDEYMVMSIHVHSCFQSIKCCIFEVLIPIVSCYFLVPFKNHPGVLVFWCLFSACFFPAPSLLHGSSNLELQIFFFISFNFTDDSSLIFNALLKLLNLAPWWSLSFHWLCTETEVPYLSWSSCRLVSYMCSSMDHDIVLL